MRVFLIIAILFTFIPPAMAGEGGYICPMHPHISGEEGGKCPICGMKLVAQEETAEPMSEDQHDMTSDDHTNMKMEDTGSEDAVYICPMHPHITGEEGDNCPICGMNLVPKEADPKPTHDQHQEGTVEGSIHIDPAYIQTLGVKTTDVKFQNFGEEIRAYGQVATNMRNEREIAVQEEGWVKELKTSAVGDVVKKGDVLFSIYSPDLMAAQSDYLIGRRTGYKIGNPEQRLRLKGMDDKAIALLKKKGKMMELTPFHAPIDGTVTALNVREGSHIGNGDVVLTIQDFSEVWINADVPIRDLQFLEEKTPARIIVPETGEGYDTMVDYIHPVSDPKSRTIKVRLVLDNPEGKIRPDSYVDVVFSTDTKSRLAVPSDAVLYGSMGAYVMEDAGEGNFRPIMVKTGLDGNGLTEIKDGLSEGQTIVSSGQFMIDAESNLRGGMAAMGHKNGE